MTVVRAAAAVGLIVLVLTHAGCPLRWQRLTVNQPLTEETVAFITPGRTGMAEVLAVLGAPDVIAPSPDGPVFRYLFLDAKYFKVIPTWGLRYLFPALAAVPSDSYSIELSHGGMGFDEFHVVFDDRWTVSRSAFASHSRASRFLPFPSRGQDG